MARRDSARAPAAPAAGAAGAAAQRLADGLARRGGPVRQWAAGGLCELGAVDRAVYSAVAATPTPSLDEPLRRLSNAANNSGLWLAVTAGLGVAGGRAGRRAAVRGTVAIGVTSALVNLAVKSTWARQRPDRAGAGVPVWRNVRMPTSTSFPSGHAASGFAFAAAIGRDQPWLGLALRFLAAAVGYSGCTPECTTRATSWSARSSARVPGRPWPAWWTGCRRPEGPPDPVAVSGVSCPMPPMRKIHGADPAQRASLGQRGQVRRVAGEAHGDVISGQRGPAGDVPADVSRCASAADVAAAGPAGRNGEEQAAGDDQGRCHSGQPATRYDP